MKYFISMLLLGFAIACQPPVSPLEEAKAGLWCTTDSARGTLFWVHDNKDSISILSGSWSASALVHEDGQWKVGAARLTTNSAADTLWLTYPTGYADTMPTAYVHQPLPSNLPASWDAFQLVEGYWEVTPSVDQFPYFRIWVDPRLSHHNLYYSTSDSLLIATDRKDLQQQLNYDWASKYNPVLPGTVHFMGRTTIRPMHHKDFYGLSIELPNDYSLWVIERWQQGTTDTLDLRAIHGSSTGKRWRWIRRSFE